MLSQVYATVLFVLVLVASVLVKLFARPIAARWRKETRMQEDLAERAARELEAKERAERELEEMLRYDEAVSDTVRAANASQEQIVQVKENVR